MFIVWGTYVRRRRVGQVAEYCAVCRAIKAAKLVELRQIGHLYYIPLGRAKPIGHSLTCAECSSELAVDLDRYAAISTEPGGSLDDLMAETNPGLLDEVEQRIELAELVEAGIATPEQRITYIYEMLWAVAAPLQKRYGNTHVDRYTFGAILSLAILPGMAWLLFSRSDYCAFIVVGSFLLALILTFTVAATELGRFLKRHCRVSVINDLMTMGPTIDELQSALAVFKAQEMALGSALSPRRLHRWIQSARTTAELTGQLVPRQTVSTQS